jgi:hypothetical protein
MKEVVMTSGKRLTLISVILRLIGFCLLSLALMPGVLSGELNLVEHLVDGNIHGTASLYACDLDRDADLDILGASMEENTIDWWRNDGGTPIQWTRLIIGSFFSEAGSVFAADLDNDSLLDVLGVARSGDQVAWWHNDGSGSVPWTKYVIRGGYDFPHEVYACDLDRDGDLDVLVASSFRNEITWWRNEGGTPIQWTEQQIGTGFQGAKSVHVADFDGDGDWDVVGAAILDDNDIKWWRNDGGVPIQWTEFVISGNFYGAHRVQAVDLDQDGRVDVLGASYYSNAVAWWRNDGGDTVNWTRQTIGTGFSGACVAQASDLDGDGDLDVVATAQAGNQVAWWRNDGGAPIQWFKSVIDSLYRAWPLFCCDLDQDGDQDVVSASSWAGTNEVKWYENPGSGVTEGSSAAVKPAVRSLITRADVTLPPGRVVRLFNASGRAVSPYGLAAGIYYLVIDNSVAARIIKVR